VDHADRVTAFPSAPSHTR